MDIKKLNKPGACKTGSLSNISKTDIDKILGFKPNVNDDTDKVRFSWGFKVENEECGIWDYKGSWKYKVYSTYGPEKIFLGLFGDKYSK